MEDRWIGFGKRGAGGLGIGHWVGRVWSTGLLRRELHGGILRRLGCGGVGAGYVDPPPKFRGKQAAKREVSGAAGEAGGVECCGVVRQVRYAKAREEAEAEIERADENPRGKAHEAGGDAEVGDEPECVGCKVLVEELRECVQVGLSEAVEKEVGDDKVVGASGGEVADVGDLGAQTRGGGGVGGVSSAGEEREHRGADVDGVDVELGVVREEAGGEAAIAIAKDESTAAPGECGQEVVAAADERGAERGVLEPAIGLGDEIEAPVHRRNGRISAGVRSARSAAALR